MTIDIKKLEKGGDQLINKRQLLTVASVAVALFFLGSMLIGGLTAVGKGKDKDEDLWKAINELQARVETLEEQSLPQGFITAPAYDSGWHTAEADGFQSFYHGLNTTEVLVYLIGNASDWGGVRHRWYGEALWWHLLTENEITIFAAPSRFAEIRVRIWKISDPT